ncbi:STAS domain-containing protein [Actinoplanes sp. NPDC049316]|uniref:STAS domain-containing protein n=1 Tax=Actinoplanes sp. NPDC049316 TaxID=3154727 RepID=UPI003439E22E
MTEPSYQITREAGAVRLSGDLDINAREELRDVLVTAVREDGSGVVVDFGDTAFLDSEAMGALIEGLLAARSAGVKMSIVNARGLVHRVLDVSGVLDMFETS